MARMYAANRGISWSSAQRTLLIFAYIWALKQFMVDRAHRIHRNLIAFSFCCAAFALGVVDRTKKNDAYGNSRERGRAPRQTFNEEKLRTCLHEGQTAMAIMGDPLDKQDTLFSHLAFIFRLVKGQTVAVGKACRPNTQQIEGELLSHFQDMWEAKQYDRVELPMSIPSEDLKYLFQDCRIPQAATGQVSDLDSSDSDYDVVVEQDKEEDVEEGSSESSEEEGTRDMTVESTDTKMMRHTSTMLISSDTDRHRLVNLSKKQNHMAEEAARRVREEYVVEDTSLQVHSQSQSCGRVVTFKRHSEERETYPHKNLPNTAPPPLREKWSAAAT